MKALFTSSQNYTVELAKTLLEKDNWEPVYFFTSKATIDAIRSAFPKAILHNYIDAVKGILPNELIDFPLKPLDLNLIDRISKYEFIAITMMDRNDSTSDSFKYIERQEFYYHLVKYWYNVLTYLDVEIVVFEEEPHQVNDYILYLMCEALSIKTIMNVRTISILGLIPMSKFEHGSNRLLELYHRKCNEIEKFEENDLPFPLRNYYLTLEGNYDKVLKTHLWDQVDKLNNLNSSSLFRNIVTQLNFIFKSILNLENNIQRLKIIKGGHFESDQKEFSKSIQNSKLSYFKFLFYKIKTIRKKLENKRSYNKLAHPHIEISKPYIFCALQYQPEKSTCPLGGRFVNQILMIELLSKNLPHGWNLYVKEHPSQFVLDYTRYGELYRNKEFYRKITKLPNTYLIPINTDVFNMIDGSSAVASVTGTICWEAAIRGKFALNFGHSWFKGCEGILDIFNNKDLENALNILQFGEQVNSKKVKLFGSLIYNLGFSAAVGGDGQLKHLGISHKENAEIHYRALKWGLFNS
jgi:hypothetical protein